MTYGTRILPIKTAKRILYRIVPFPQLGNWAYSRNHRRVDSSWAQAPYFLLHVPKCAGTSIVNALHRPDPGHLLVTDLDLDSQKALSGLPALIVIRNPVDRIVSTFRYAHSQHQNNEASYLLNITRYDDINDWVCNSLPRYVVSKHYFFRSARAYIREAQAIGMLVHAIAMDNLNGSFSLFHERMTGMSLSLPLSNRSHAEADAAEKLTKTSREVIRSLYSDDVHLHDSAVGKPILSIASNMQQSNAIA